MNNTIDYSIENGSCLSCGKTIEEMEEDGEDVIQHLEEHMREDTAN